MKNQYVGDINDYCKYGLLRSLIAADGGNLAVCWMLTRPDGRADGEKLDYLEAPEVFRDFDALVFDTLGDLVRAGGRDVSAVAATRILPDASFYVAMLGDRLLDREKYFRDLWSTLGTDDFIFFDPDNGFEVSSVPKGSRMSSKYLYWDEFAKALELDRTVCVYQHFPRRQRREFSEELLAQITQIRADCASFALTTPWVAYFVAGPRDRVQGLRAAAQVLLSRPGSPFVALYESSPN